MDAAAESFDEAVKRAKKVDVFQDIRDLSELLPPERTCPECRVSRYHAQRRSSARDMPPTGAVTASCTRGKP